MRLLSSFNAVAAASLGLLLQPSYALAQALETVGKPIPYGTDHQPAATNIARDLQWLDHMIHIIIGVIVLFVTVLLLYIIVRYAKKRNAVPATFTHNSPLEVAWTIVPILVLVFIGSFSLPALFEQQEIPVADLTIKVTGNQWYWSYEYPDVKVGDDTLKFDAFRIDGATKIDDAAAGWGDDQPMSTAEVLSDVAVKKLAYFGYKKEDFLLATDNAVVIPVGKTVVMQITGADVIHAWAIPAFGVMQSAVPGRLGQLWFKAEQEGVYFGQCTNICGKDHAYMPITVKVVSQAAYDAWIAQVTSTGNLRLASN
ncbi:cytochrome c oxidase subunit II [Cypionkella sp.]|uniref:cytochrome c oxidase subunit II n=1 Tax=Cypionkella sp. TaxID=2811411 RepID=UPI00260D5214|nr:cytochrome c oxidase subunit II [Cypionkella sp.]MDB5664910.1 cytochrome c oxidase subunit 2 [Cypionkella sp.]